MRENSQIIHECDKEMKCVDLHMSKEYWKKIFPPAFDISIMYCLTKPNQKNPGKRNLPIIYLFKILIPYLSTKILQGATF